MSSPTVLDYNPTEYNWIDVGTMDKPVQWARGLPLNPPYSLPQFLIVAGSDTDPMHVTVMQEFLKRNAITECARFPFGKVTYKVYPTVGGSCVVMERDVQQSAPPYRNPTVPPLNNYMPPEKSDQWRVFLCLLAVATALVVYFAWGMGVLHG